MTFPLSPGAYTKETDNSFRVPATSDSVGAIVISANKGPANKVTLITSNKDFVETFGKPTPSNPSMHSALAFLTQGRLLQVVRGINGALTATVDAEDATPDPVFTVDAANPGTWGNSITVSATVADGDGFFTITVKYSGTQVETFKVTRDTAAVDGYGKTMYIEDVVNTRSNYIRITDVPANVNAHVALTDAPLTGGANDTTALTDTIVNTAWDLFSNKEEVEVSILINAGWATTSVQTKMIAIAEARKDCIAVLDVPSGTVTAGDAVTYAGTTLNKSTSYAALYAPWVQIYDQYTDRKLYVPPSGWVASVYAATDDTTETWYAPAGSRRGQINVIGLETVWSEGDRDTLYEANINPIQSFPGEGIQVYGQKTLQANPSALDRVNVRRLMISIEKSIHKALRAYIFEFNDRFTRSDITALLNNYMGDVQARRGVTGFAVVCDESNNTPVVIDSNQLLVDVYVKPTRAAEFILLNAVVSSTGATISSS